MAVRDVIIKESEVGSIPDLLDDGSELGIWHPDDGHQDDDNRERQDTSTAIKEEWHDAGSVNNQETRMRQEASDVGETALDEGSTATRGSHKESESLEDSDTEDFSQLETVGFNEDELEHADKAEPRRETRARKVPQFFGEVRTHLAVTEGNYVEPKAVYEAKQGDDWDQWAMKDEVRALQDNETWNLVRPPTDRTSYRANGSTKWNWDPVVKWTNTKRAMWRKASNKWKDWTTLSLLRLPASQRHSGLYFSYQRSRAMWCTNLMSRLLSCTHQSRKKCIWNSHRSL